MKYLPLETCKHLVSLGCTSESSVFYTRFNGGTDKDGDIVSDWIKTNADHGRLTNIWEHIPAFSLEDLLRKENAERIWPGYAHCIPCTKKRCDWQVTSKFCCHFYPECLDWHGKTIEVLGLFQSHPDTWPEEVSKLITPKAEEGGEDKET